MYPVSEAYKNWIYNNNSPEGRIFDISGYIDAPFGRVDIDPADLVAGSVKLEDATISSDSLEVGSVFSAGLSFSVYNNKPEYSDISFNGCEASFSVGYKLESGVFEWVLLGQFIIIESSVPANTISFRALDKMILLSSVKWADINVVFPATVREIANACFSAAALPPLPADSFLHDDYVVDAAFTDDNFTARDIVSYCAQIAGCYAKIDRNGTPKFGWYGDIRTPVYYNLNANSDEITGLGIEDGALKVLSGGYEEQDESFYSVGLDDRIDFRVSGSTIYVTGILYEHGEESRLYGRREYLIVLEDNPLVQENMDAVMSAVYEKIGRFAYIPYESKIFGDPAREAGDLVTILHKDGTEYHTIITNISYTFRGESSIEARGKSRELNSVQGSTVKKISSIAQNLKKNEDQLSLFGQSMLNNSNLIANMLGGYAIQTESDFYIADNPDINLASKVWKWGIGGFGYSESGIGGPYVTNVSASGSIVAYLIDAGIVRADNVTTGVLQSQNGHSKLNLNDGTFNFGNGNLVWNGTKLTVNGDVTVTGGTIDGSKASITNINATNVKTGTLKSQNNYSWLNLNDGKFSFGNGALTWNGSILTVKGLFESESAGRKVTAEYGQLRLKGSSGQLYANFSTFIGTTPQPYLVIDQDSTEFTFAVSTVDGQINHLVARFTKDKWDMYKALSVSGNLSVSGKSSLSDVNVQGKITQFDRDTIRRLYSNTVDYGNTGDLDHVFYGTNNGALQPATDNYLYLGRQDFRWKAIFSVNGTIQTSGLKDKENVKPLKNKSTENAFNVTARSFDLEEMAEGSTEVYREDFIDLLDLIASNGVTYNYKQDGADISQESIQLGVIADEISDHPAYKYIGVKEVSEGGIINYGLQPLPIAMLAIQGYADLRKRIEALEQKQEEMI